MNVLEIVRVGVVGGDMMDVHLSNGNILMLGFEPLLGESEFAILSEDDRIFYPKTDGTCVFWRGGPRLTIEEIFSWMGRTG